MFFFSTGTFRLTFYVNLHHVEWKNNLDVSPKKASFIMFSSLTENRVWTRCQILLKWTYFRTWNWKQPLFDQMTHNKTKNIVQINQDVKKGQWPGVSTEFVHLVLCPSISISLSAVENEDQLVSSFTLLLIFKSCPTGEKTTGSSKK